MKTYLIFTYFLVFLSVLRSMRSALTFIACCKHFRSKYIFEYITIVVLMKGGRSIWHRIASTKWGWLCIVLLSLAIRHFWRLNRFISKSQFRLKSSILRYFCFHFFLSVFTHWLCNGNVLIWLVKFDWLAV